MADFTSEEIRAAIAKIAYDESCKGLQIQDATLTSIRQGAVAIGTLSGLVATFLGKSALEKLQSLPLFSGGMPSLISHGAAAAALVALCASLLLVAYLYRPTDRWKFHSSATSILTQFAERPEPESLSVTYGVLARFKQDDYDENEVKLSRMYPAIAVLIALLAVQIIAWCVALFLL